MKLDLNSLIFENQFFIVINKPVGYEFHGPLGVLNVLRQHFPQLYGVHRLDKATSGLMVFAKDKNTQKILSEIFSKRKVKKIYLALSSNRPIKKQGKICGDIVKSRSGNYKLTRQRRNPSLTQFVSCYNDDTSLRCFALRPLTGRTHQLRVVMSSLAAPILGDDRYGGEPAQRLYLHAYQLSFEFSNELFDFRYFPDENEYYHQTKNDFLTILKKL
ncbi:MAG: pseudouridine synthase [Bacteriovoracaceae bacterium]|jgi:tRNA pseudouridine32 synthase/23S rRNA pseudouridine746 synthase|nr:RNA pseudouridine synthase [Halobacteriovoraceae bacterium]MDP7320095.1 pseudouridine synthase [Bacteriovoracaceae bacterium]